MASDVGAVVEESPRQIKEKMKMIYFQASIYRVGNQRYPRFQDYQASRRKCSGVGVEHLGHRASRTDGPHSSQMSESHYDGHRVCESQLELKQAGGAFGVEDLNMNRRSPGFLLSKAVMGPLHLWPWRRPAAHTFGSCERILRR